MLNHDRREAVQVATTVTIIMAFVFVALRMISRIFITRHTTWDDYVMVLAWAIAFGGSLTILLAAQKGFGLMDVDLKPEWIPPLKRYGYAYSILYVQPGPDGYQDEHSHILPTPFEDEKAIPDWNIRNNRGGKCVTLFLASSPSNVFTDVAILVLPIPVLTGIHLPWRQKSILILTFGLGIFVTIVDVVRIYYLQKALGVTTANSSTLQVTPGLGASPNFVYNVSYGLMWSIVEVNIGIVCGCIPLLKPLVVKTMPKLINPPKFRAGHSTHTSPDNSATQTMPEDLPTRQRSAPHNEIEGLTPLDFRMPANPLPEMSMTPALSLGTPAPQNSQTTSISSMGEMGDVSSQLPSRQVSLSPVQEGGSSLQHSLQEPSLQSSTSSASGHNTPAEQTGSLSSLSAEHESGPTARRLQQQTGLSPQHNSEDHVNHLPQPADDELLSQQQQQRQDMEMMDFLTAPGMSNPPGNVSAHGQPNQIHFGFVKIRQPKSMLRTSLKDSWKYCAWVSVSFFLLGFSYGLLNTLNVQIALIAHYTQALTVSLHTIYFGAYLIGPLTIGLYCLNKGGFKATLMVGMCIFGTGTLVFWPCSILLTYPGFIVSNFIIGFGLAVFETAANPFIVLCGPPRYGESRLLGAQFMRGIGAIVSQSLVEKAFFPPDEVHDNVLSIRWTYLAISFITVILALIFHYTPLPEASDEDLQNSVQTRLLPLNHTINHDPKDRIFGFRIVYVSLAFACFAQFAYMFTQETFNVWFNNSLLTAAPGKDLAHRRLLSPNFVLIGHGAFALSMLLASILCLYVQPRYVLLGSLIGCAAFRLAFTLIPEELAKEDSTKVAALAIVQYFCEGPVFSIIFGLALRGLGAKTKIGSALVTTMIGGGAPGPWVVLGIIRQMGNYQRPFAAGVALLFLATLYPLYLCLVPKAREIVDWHDDGDAAESEWRRSQPDSIAAVEAANAGVYSNGNGIHWPARVEKEFEHIRRASATSGKAVSKWAANFRDWTRRVSGLGKEASPREFA
ncbi:hypothetical protein V494_03743 [Pseudogymnoascus sp. VKM F-4513 (FW-928)]|nr:hypothetical protein V494_03743 [Pseudogymnoascus sp. VKM F-4513 (FW-928)]